MGAILSQPFFANLLMRREFVEDATVQDLTTNGEVFRYNPEYFEKLPQHEAVAVLCSAAMHIANYHHLRRNSRDSKMWNDACDYAINPLLLESGLKLPEGYLINDSYKGFPAEQIYAKLQEKKQEEQKQQPGAGQPGAGQQQPEPKQQPGQVEDSPAKSESEKEEAEAKLKKEIAQAAQAAKMAGKLPGGMKELLETLLENKVNWRDVLAEFIQRIVNTDYTFSRPNLRYIQQGYILPSLHNQEIGDVIIVIDVSDSVNRELVQQGLAEVQDIAAFLKVPEVRIMQVNTRIVSDVTLDIETNFKKELHVHKGGGTKFAPAFDLLENDDTEPPSALIYFTDGECNNYPKIIPDYPVLWATYGRLATKFAPPFGEVIPIN